MRTTLSLTSDSKKADEDCNQILDVLIAYNTVAARQRAMRLLSNLDRDPPADETHYPSVSIRHWGINE